MNIAIVSVAYNRIDSLSRQLRTLEQGDYPEPVTLVLSIDKSKNTAVEDFARNYHWPYGEKRVITHEKNLGTRRHIMSLGTLFDEFDALIVLEDDITVAPAFYHYAKVCIESYGNDPLVAGISLYNFPVNYQTRLPFQPVRTDADVYLMQCAQSWGEVWTHSQWMDFKQWYDEQKGKFLPNNDVPEELYHWPESSWLRFHTRYCIEKGLYFVYPYTSLSTNNQDKGVNSTQRSTIFQSAMLYGNAEVFRLPPVKDIRVRYDAFFEPQFISSYLGVDDAELTVDLNGKKKSHRRYLLSLRSLPFAVVKSYALHEKPIEMNVIHHNDGRDIFLYDTTQPAQRPKETDPVSLYSYFYGEAFYKQRTMIGVFRSLGLWCMLVRNKLKQ
jgi:hypothetical protein